MRSPDRRVVSILGLAARAGGLVYGTDLVRRAAQAGRVHVAVVATDISDNTRQKLDRLLGSGRALRVAAMDRASLGAAVGRSRLSAVGVTDPAFAARLRELVDGGDGQD